MMEFIWNLHQQHGIAEAKAEAADAKDALNRYQQRVRELEFSVARMALATQALWELLRERVGISDAELLARITEIDLRDGAQDGRMTPIKTSCPKCGRVMNSKSSRCIYCGRSVVKPHLFQS
jgi:hypothetical protein